MSVRRAFAILALPLAGMLACTELRETSANATAETVSAAPLVAIFSAFPAEMAPILAEATVDDTMTFNGRTFYLGTLRGVHVVLGITGIGLDNAQATAHAVLSGLPVPVTGVVFSGVAGGGSADEELRIGDVAAPAVWSLASSPSQGTFAADPAWLTLASDLVATSPPCFEQCTVVQWTGQHVCLGRVPGVALGGQGRSEPAQSGGTCDVGGDDVFGCDVGAPQGDPETCQTGGVAPRSTVPDAGGDAGDATAAAGIVDNETAAVAAEAAQSRLPFLAFRGISDGAGDPLGLPGFPGEFFAYYRLAARNAAATTLAFVTRLGAMSSARGL
jgi:nucleoside phosphorylase